MFNGLLSQTSVAMEINARSSLTILAVADSVLKPMIDRFGGNIPDGLMGDICRYHVLLQYLDVTEIRSMTNATGVLLTTLYQTTGRAAANDGFLNLTVSKSGVIGFGMPVGGGPPNATLEKSVASYPYNISIFQIDHMLMPIGVSNNAAGQVDLISVLEKAGKFNTLVTLLKNSGVGTALASKETGPGLTVLAPSDDAFNALPNGAMAKLTDVQKATMLKFHVLSSYFPLGSLQTVSNPALPTEASGSSGGKYTQNISSVKGVVIIDTGVSKAQITNTLYDQPPVSVFAIDNVLLPPELFAASPGGAPGPSPLGSPVPQANPALAPTPLTPAPLAEPPSPLLSPVSVPIPSPASVPVLSPIPSTPTSSPPAPPPSEVIPGLSPEIAPGPSVRTNAGAASFSFHHGLLILFLMASASLLL
ncbi:hypothetical protein O6H91_20G045400 [Diphasiastrum complanatum]|nr:hypothetical protein O6H91_20G045400 [Diphasiastrum complanatum]